MALDPWLLTGLLALSIVLTLLTNWLVSDRRRPTIPYTFSPSDVAAIGASVLWILLMLFAGFVASRYIERIEHAAIGYVCFGLVVGVLSWIRAILFRRLQGQGSRNPAAPSSQRLSDHVRLANHLLFAIDVYLLGAWILQQAVDPVLLVPLCLGALLPDLDSPVSEVGRLLPAMSRKLETRFGQQQGWHSLAANALIAALTSPMLLLFGTAAWVLLSLGFLSHLVLDLFTPQGVMLFWPLNRTHYSLAGRPVPARDSSGSPKPLTAYPQGQGAMPFMPLNHTPYSLAGRPAPTRDSSGSRKLLAALGILSILLLLSVDVGRPSPAPAPSPTYEQTLQRYHSLRGNNLVYANIEGTWQISGRKTYGTFEILNAVGNSYILLDRYAGTVFNAGRSADDNLYLSRITLQTGPSASVKPVQIHLQHQTLGDGLRVVYEMQQEPGLQHIYVSGDLVIPSTQDPGLPTLQQDYAQTSVRHIQAHEPGHFSLHYLTAADLIALANVPVDTADLIVVATYATPATGPTVTPLPAASGTQKPGP